MFMPRTLIRIAVVASILIALPVNAQDLGQQVTEDDLALWDLTTESNGTGLPPGSGTARTGQSVWSENCAACHGAKADGGPAGSLVGGIGSLTSAAPVKTVGSYWPYATSLFDYVRRAMPYQDPGSLSDDELYAVVAYILNRNEIIDDDAVMNAKSLKDVKMPNRNGFVSYWPSPLKN